MFDALFQKLSLKRQMYLLAGCSTVCLVAVATAGWMLIARGVEPAVGMRVLEGAAIGLSLLMFAVAWMLGNFCARRAEQLVNGLGALAKGDLTHRVAIPGKDEFAWMSYEYSNARKSFSNIVNEIMANAGHLAAAAEELSAITEQAKQGVVNQNRETEQVATAMNEMSATVHEVARNAANAADSAEEANQEATKGRDVVSATVKSIGTLAHEVEHTSEVIAKLKEDSLSIGAVLDVIRDIAEQTNLLALNAAIEAARAGEQGRGFAVVADEVRTLASRTQHSTQEIQQMIQRLQSGANEAVHAMEQGRSSAESSVEQAARAGAALESITQVVGRITDMNTQIASAAEQQSATSEEINRNVANITAIAGETAQGAQQTAQASDELAQLAVKLQELVGRFKLAS